MKRIGKKSLFIGMAIMLMMGDQSIYVGAQESELVVDCTKIQGVSVSYNDQISVENGMESTENLETFTKAEEITIDEANFPDGIFREYVLDNLDMNGDGWLSISEIEQTTSIYVADKGITSLQGINYFINLKELWCQENQLSELDVSQCLNLESLWCSSNQLSKLDLNQCTKLWFLHCNYNQISELNINKCLNLQRLYCTKNQLNELDVSQCKYLVYLYCEENQINELIVSQCSNLRYLWCSGNELSTLDISGCMNLYSLSCDRNQLSKLDISNCKDLNFLSCMDNQLSALDVSNCAKLEHLNCGNNQLISLDVSQNISLKELLCSYNNYIINSQTLDISKLPGFDITKVVDGYFTNAILSGHILSPLDSSKPVTYQYDTGWQYDVTWNTPFRFSIQFPVSVNDIFSDISRSNWYYNAVQFSYDNGIMSGKGNGQFDPAGNLTRAEFVTTLYSMEEKPVVSYKNTFSDVPNGEWYTNSVLWANQIDIASGYGNGKFGVSDNITREQLAMMVYKYAVEVCGYEPESTEDILLGFSDANKVSSWAVKAMEWAVTNGIISGTGDNRLNPQGNALRCECAQILKSFHDRFGN